MARPISALLALADHVVRFLIVLNFLYGAGILLLMLASLVAPDMVFRALLHRSLSVDGGAAVQLRLLMVLGLAGATVTHLILSRVRDILATVRDGDPFVAGNGRRIHQLAIGVVCLELLHLLAGAIIRGEAVTRLDIHMHWSFAFTPWIAALLLFVLGGVFDHGAAMRADLDGTV